MRVVILIIGCGGGFGGVGFRERPAKYAESGEIDPGLDDGVGRSDKENSDEDGVGRLLCVAWASGTSINRGSVDELLEFRNATISSSRRLCRRVLWELVEGAMLNETPSRWAPK